MNTPLQNEPESGKSSARGLTMLSYGLLGIAQFTGLAMMVVGPSGIWFDLIAVPAIFLLVKNKPSFKGTIYESHAIWLIWTFVITLIAFVLAGIIFMVFGVTSGTFVSLLAMLGGLYYIYRVVKGFRLFARAQAIADPTNFY